MNDEPIKSDVVSEMQLLIDRHIKFDFRANL